MLPILLDLKFIKIYTFGVFLVLGFFWGLFFLWRTIKLTSYKEEEIFDSVFISLFWSIFFARVFYVFFNFSTFGLNPLKFILINGFPGLSAWGGLFGAVSSLYLYYQSKKMEFIKIVDYLIPAFFIALVFLKIGSFFGGVDVGTQTNFFVAVKYLGYQGNRHIVALYEAILFGICSIISYKILLLIRREKFAHGIALFFFLFTFSLDNLLLDNMKQNHLYFARININVSVSAVLAVFFAAYFIHYFRKEIRSGLLMLKDNIVTYGKKTRSTISRKIKKGTTKSGDHAHKTD